VHALDLLERDKVLVDAEGPAEDLEVDLDDGRDVWIEDLDREAVALGVARPCTWPSDAAAIGSLSKLVKTSVGAFLNAL
jgi:hypothetical protein